MNSEDVKIILSNGGNYIGNINFIDRIEGETIYLNGDQGKKSEDNKELDMKPQNKLPDTISEDIIPPELQAIYSKLSPKKKLMCLAIVYLQKLEDEGRELFRLDNDWWAVYSPMVYDEELKLPQKPDVFYCLMQEIGMGYFRVNCTRDRMMKINGVFLKHYKDWKVENYYGERPWAFLHKQKIASRLADILKQLHEQMEI